MKSPACFFLFFFLISTAKSQQYQPMAIEGAHWLMYSINDGIVNHHFLAINGDTVLGGLTYKKVYRKDIQNNSIVFDDLMSPFYITQSSLAGFLRDDTLSQQVFTHPTANEWQSPNCPLFSHEMIHDYSLQPLDTLMSCLNLSDPVSSTVYSVSTEFLFGENRRVIQFESGNIDIEGIGVIDPFWPVHAFFTTKSPQILVDYCVGSDTDCGILPTSTIENSDKWNFKLYPNPANGFVEIEFPNNFSFPLEIKVYDLSGRAFYTKSIEGKCGKVNLDICHLPAGLYILSITNKATIEVSKLLVND